jgi:hypothetical protein
VKGQGNLAFFFAPHALGDTLICMRNFLKSLSLNTLGFAAIVACLAVLLASNPPRGICDAEIDNFRQGMVGVMYPNPKLQGKPPTIGADKQLCLDRNSPGACMELFADLKRFLDVSSTVSEQCLQKLGEQDDFQNVLIKSLDLMVKLAWGPTNPPAAPALKNGWLNSSDVYLFCRLKNRATQVYGDKRWEVFREKYFVELPGAKGLSRQQVWEKSLLSTNCNSL